MKQMHTSIQETDENLLTDVSSIYRYSRVMYIEHNLWAITDIKTHKTGVVDIYGNQIIPCMYDDVFGLLDGTCDFLVYKDNYYGLVNKNGNEIIKPKYEDFEGGLYYGLWAVKLNNKWGFIDRNDNVVIPFKYDWVSYFFENKAKAILNGEEFFIDQEGKRIS